MRYLALFTLLCSSLVSQQLPSGATATTQAANDSSTKLATTSYVDTKYPILGAQVTKAANQSIPNSTATLIVFDTTVRDDGTFFTGGSSNQLTVPTGDGGWYIVTANVAWDSSTTQTRYTSILKNAAATGASSATSAVASTGQSASIVLHLVPTDFITLQVQQFSGGNVNATASLSLVRVTP